jgi:hypothetical protein
MFIGVRSSNSSIKEVYALDQFERENANDMGAVSGRQVIFPIHTARNRGRGAIPEAGTLPTAGAQSYANGTVKVKYLAQGIELTDRVIKSSETNEGAFVRALTAEIEGATTDLRKDINRQVYGTGDGVLSTISTATTSGATVTVDSIQYIAVGDFVDIIKSDGTTKVANGVQVTAVASTGTAASSTQSAGTITLASAVSAPTGTGAFVTLAWLMVLALPRRSPTASATSPRPRARCMALTRHRLRSGPVLRSLLRLQGPLVIRPRICSFSSRRTFARCPRRALT